MDIWERIELRNCEHCSTCSFGPVQDSARDSLSAGLPGGQCGSTKLLQPETVGRTARTLLGETIKSLFLAIFCLVLMPLRVVKATWYSEVRCESCVMSDFDGMCVLVVIIEDMNDCRIKMAAAAGR